MQNGKIRCVNVCRCDFHPEFSGKKTRTIENDASELKQNEIRQEKKNPHFQCNNGDNGLLCIVAECFAVCGVCIRVENCLVVVIPDLRYIKLRP